MTESSKIKLQEVSPSTVAAIKRHRNASCHYKYMEGIDLVDQINERYKSVSRSITLYIIASGFLYDEKHPFTTFFRKDVDALRSDWEFSGQDLAVSIITLLRRKDNEFKKQFLQEMLDYSKEEAKKGTQLTLPLEEPGQKASLNDR